LLPAGASFVAIFAVNPASLATSNVYVAAPPVASTTVRTIGWLPNEICAPLTGDDGAGDVTVADPLG
jgi:hypothetical protein